LQSARLRAKHAKAAAGSDDEDDEDDVSVEEELGFESPLDDVNPYVALKYALGGEALSLMIRADVVLTPISALQMVNAPAYQAATTSLTPEQATSLMEFMAIAETAEREEAAVINV
jgi:spermidine/putrescine-binding protein